MASQKTFLVKAPTDTDDLWYVERNPRSLSYGSLGGVEIFRGMTEEVQDFLISVTAEVDDEHRERLRELREQKLEEVAKLQGRLAP